MLSDYLYYDETSSTCLRWKVYRKGSGKGKPKFPGDEAGTFFGRYAQVRVEGKKQYVHRIIWELHYSDPGEMDVDHRDRNTFNNKVDNLRLIPHTLNQRNMSLNKANTSGVTGVTFKESPSPGRWVANWIDLGGKSRGRSFNLSKYGDLAFELATEARNKAILKLNQAGAGYTPSHGKTQGEINEK